MSGMQALACVLNGKIMPNKMKINKDLIIGDTNKTLEDLVIPDTGWKDITFGTGYSNWDTTVFNSCQCRKIGNIVYLKGLLKKNSGSASGYDIIAYLPEGFRPSKRILISCLINQRETTRIDIHNDGSMRLPSGIWDDMNMISFEGIFFFV